MDVPYKFWGYSVQNFLLFCIRKLQLPNIYLKKLQVKGCIQDFIFIPTNAVSSHSPSRNQCLPLELAVHILLELVLIQ